MLSIQKHEKWFLKENVVLYCANFVVFQMFDHLISVSVHQMLQRATTTPKGQITERILFQPSASI